MTGEVATFECRRPLVTGGAGFIGSALVRRLSVACEEVVVLDNLANGKRENLEDLLQGNVKLVIGDIRDACLLADLLPGTDVLFHLACLGVRHSIHSPSENHEVNATGTLQLLKAAKVAGISRFVHISSSEVYGTGTQPLMTEEHPTFPMTVYGAAKLAGECYARAFFRTYGYSTVVIRPFNTYGPRCHHEGDSGEVIPKFLLRCMAGRPMLVFGDGTQTRDFMYVTDTVRGILMAGLSSETAGETLNLGTGRKISINELATAVAAVVDRSDARIDHLDPRPGDTLHLCADISKTRRLTGFEPAVSLHDGLIKLRTWYEETGKVPEDLLDNEVVRNWTMTDSRPHAAPTNAPVPSKP